MYFPYKRGGAYADAAYNHLGMEIVDRCPHSDPVRVRVIAGFPASLISLSKLNDRFMSKRIELLKSA